MPLAPNEEITNHFQISSPLNKNMLESFILIGSPSEIEYLNSSNNIKLIKEMDVRFTNMPIKIYEVSF